MSSRASAANVDPANGSDDETGSGAGPSGQGKTQRIAKACDRCRKSKSKCEPAPNEGQPCKTCGVTGAECTYTAPSFRRGPPKGYIQALEHRLHQVESVLAAIMSSADPRAVAIIDELGQDELAGFILETVDVGPFGKTGREKRAIDTSKDNFFASIVAEQPKARSHRSRRQSRATRENVISVISTDPQIQTTRPTLAWQDRLSARLESRDGSASASQSISPRSVYTPLSGSADGFGSEPPRNKRRLDNSSSSRSSFHARTSAPTLQSDADADGDNLDDCENAFGNLSIDENREVRYHGNSAGLQLLALAERRDGRNAKGIWRFPMAKLWPGPRNSDRDLADTHAKIIEDSIRMPPIHVQDYLIEVFFTYANPLIPVLDRESFMTQYDPLKYSYRDPEVDPHSGNDGDIRPERPQKLSKLLLLAVFAYAASHLDPRDGRAGNGSDPAAEYTRDARTILDTVYHESRSSTVQALVLMGIREFGAGSLEEGWLHIGMATRMALDLGLNRNPDKWTHNNRELFTEKEKDIRKRIWWGCCLADKFSALFLGRTIGIHEDDFSTPHLDIPPDDLEQTWQPCPPDPLCGHFTPVPAMYVSYFRHLSSLYVIAGEVLAKIYRVSRANVLPSRTLREQLYQRLTQWSLDLPEHMRCNPSSSNRPCPAPNILALHIQYWAIVLLMHRPFIPKGSELARAGSPSLDPDPVPWESFDICQSAAHQVASFAMLYHETYHMKWAPPFLSNCLQAAGVLCVVTLRYKPMDAQASVALQKVINACSGLEQTWITAFRVRDLIQNAKVHVDRTLDITSRRASDGGQGQIPSQSQALMRQKRPAEVAFDDIVFPPPPRGMVSTSSISSVGVPVMYQPTVHVSQPSLHQSHPGTRDAPDPSAYYVGYVPGYDSWWPVLEGQTDGSCAGTGPVGPIGQPDDGRGAASAGMVVPSGSGGLPSQDFTFSTHHFSPDFLQAMRDPVIHFPAAFARQGY